VDVIARALRQPQPDLLMLGETVAKVTSPQGEGVSRVLCEPVYVLRLFSFGCLQPESGQIAPGPGADYVVFPLLGLSHLPIASARHNAGLRGAQLASRSRAIRLQLTTMQVSNA